MYTKSRSEKIFNIFNIMFMLCICVTIIYPMLNVLAISFNDGQDTAMSSSFIFPRKFTLENYRIAIRYPSMINAFFVSIARTILGTAFHMSVVALAAYAMSKKKFMFRGLILTFFILPMYVNPGIVPQYLNLKMLHLTNNFFVYVFTYGFSFFNFIIIRTYMQSLPPDIEESAYIDGAGFWTIFVKIVVPLSIPTIAAISLFHAVMHWNDWYASAVYVTNKKLWTLQYVLQKVLREQQQMVDLRNMSMFSSGGSNYQAKLNVTPTSLRMTILVITTAPILFVYPFIQKYFAQGMMIGAVKG